MKIRFIEKIESENLPIYFTNDYISIFAKYDKSFLRILEIEKENFKVFLPILIHKFDYFYEAYTCYGYGGFYSKEGNIKLTEEEIEELKNFLKDNKIIDLFIRNTPFLENNKIIPSKYNTLNRITYIKLLKHYETFEELKKNIDQSIRWSVNYAIKNRLEVRRKLFNDVTNKEISSFY